MRVNAPVSPRPHPQCCATHIWEGHQFHAWMRSSLLRRRRCCRSDCSGRKEMPQPPAGSHRAGALELTQEGEAETPLRSEDSEARGMITRHQGCLSPPPSSLALQKNPNHCAKAHLLHPHFKVPLSFSCGKGPSQGHTTLRKRLMDHDHSRFP